jgi:DNA replication factor GINS
MSARQSSSESDAVVGNGGSVTLKEIYKLLKREIESSALQSIEPDTFQKIAAALGSLRGQGYEGVEGSVRDRLADLLANSARLLIETRVRKLRACREPVDYSKLTDEEKYALDGISESEDRIREVIAATTKGRVKVLESISAKVRNKQVIVRFIRPVESFVGVDMNKYGPFQQEDVASLPLENARSIVDSGLAVRVHAEP